MCLGGGVAEGMRTGKYRKVHGMIEFKLNSNSETGHFDETPNRKKILNLMRVRDFAVMKLS